MPRRQRASFTCRFLATHWDLGFRPPERINVCEWVEANVILSDGETSSPGQYRFRRAPYMREVLEALSPDSPVQYVVGMKGAQIGATIASAAYVAFLIAQRPCNILFVSPTVDLATRASRRKVGPILQCTDALRALVREGGGRKAASSTLYKEFPGGALIFAGANSGAGLRQTSAQVCILDEIDIYPASIPGEGDPVVLAERATKTFEYSRKHLYLSTPTIEGRSRIATLYEQSDKSRFYVPCPKCGEFQVLVFTDKKTGRRGLRWEGEHPNLRVWYQCEKCEAQIDEGSKGWMLDRGVWRADVPRLSDHFRGFHISSLYAAPGTFSWRDVVAQFVTAAKDAEKLRAFVNQVLGETWEERGDAPAWEDLYRRREIYTMGIVPDRGLVLTAGADVQRDRIEVEIVAWGRGLESWSVDYVILAGDTASEKPWIELDRLFARPWKHAGGLDLRIRGLAVDSGFETQGVYNWCRKKPADSVFAVKGAESVPTLAGHPSYVDLNWRGKKVARAVRLWMVGTSVAKRELYGWLRLQAPLHEAEGEPWPAGFVHFPQYREEHFKQLTAEQLVARHRKSDRQIVYVWDRKYERNEALDCRVYARAAAAIVGLDRWSDADWDSADAALHVKDGAPVAAAPVSRKRAKTDAPWSRWR